MKRMPVEAVAECPRIVCSVAAARESFSASPMPMQLICACILLHAADGMYDNVGRCAISMFLRSNWATRDLSIHTPYLAVSQSD